MVKSERPIRATAGNILEGNAFRRALWLFVILGTLYIVFRRYESYEGITPVGPNGSGGDFWQFLHASQMIASGHNPYSFAQLRKGNGYVYTPLVALLLVPFCHDSVELVWHVWTLVTLLSLAIFCAIAATTFAKSIRDWRRPVLFGFVVVTAFQFAPTTAEFLNGQTDAFVLIALAMAVAANERTWSATSGVLVGIGALIKTWPGGAVIAWFRRDVRGLKRFVGGFIATIVLGPLLALALGGTSEVSDLVRVTLDAGSQHLVNFSAWGVPRLLFTSSGLARPDMTSTALLVISTVVFVGWVSGLLVISLRRRHEFSLIFWNAMACVVLLLPVSHVYYTMYMLPILWCWAAKSLMAEGLTASVLVTTGIMLLWWLALFNLQLTFTATTSSLQLSAPFFVNLVGLTASVTGSRLLRTNRPPTTSESVL